MGQHQKCRQHFFKFTWIFIVYFPSVCSGQGEPRIVLNSTVFVAFQHETVVITADLMIPVNQTKDILKCTDPSGKQIYSCEVAATPNQPEIMSLSLELEKVIDSGEYSCQYKTATVYLFLRLRDEGYKKGTWNYTECIVAIFTGMLLLFSVVGSVCVFRGNWKEYITKCGDSCRKQKQNREERTTTANQEGSVDVTTAPATSFYASLEHRPRSIYDVLDHSAANSEPDQSKAKGKKKKVKQTTEQTTQQQQEGVFESVYENF